ncbi:MAG: tRNA (guanosine(37)-N1)-methyltransferase TrmD [Candidatus Abyssobacteria bacterium SURF_17]|uniref:tRNA (guanine-N(1)-)-methyltransferase n=1 Tax=Candidatus Abyssobacteria bacterium SURF_17 TaxID=2093361 RepID=A0A419F8J3_9BACT|nr:MAG: tRNA (guanosine(37)-N1)-methyltransferase TrmD [Candidatus Abyssubacteria bacterium SURF_17]
MRIDVITLFPGMFAGPLSESIIGRAIGRGILSVHVVNLRDFCEGKHRQADDKPYGGGPGMVLMAEPIFKAVESLSSQSSLKRIILTSAQGSLFNQEKARELAAEQDMVIICGRYEGVDERVAARLSTDEISIGDYVLTGGELPALVLIDAVCRLIPGVVGCAESLEQDSFNEGLLGYPQYTRPPELRGMNVPEVLISGNHAQIAQWRRQSAIRKTFRNRRELLGKVSLTEEEAEFVRTLERVEG